MADTKTAQQLYEIAMAYIDVQIRRPPKSASADLSSLPWSKETIKAALQWWLARDDRTPIDDELIRGCYLALADYQPPLTELIAAEKDRLRNDLSVFPVRPVPPEFRANVAAMFPELA